jgi:glycosyltransferase involved in cell wall biosynthesis
MALAIQRIATDRELYQSIRSRAIQDINEQFSFSRMADRIETQLDRIIADTRRGGK